ncbi:MAG: glycoside hydrolase family 3 N-terminal domain-containing protein [Anaerolineales bacterium]|nr:MAG: glycoside hydrolase family 3 N-terminal domain-containing protein [Anaerolineales bacterium]
MDIERSIGQKLLFAFHGREKPSPEIVNAFKKYHPGGVSLFRSLNMGTLPQIRELNASLQRLAREFDLPPLIIATDQEGGQLMAVGDGTQLPGNMALGAARSKGLARKAGEVLGREMSALGINVNYAPCADVNVNPQNPVVGTRSFGEDPILVGELAAAMIEGIQSQGVAATVKHFPGHGDTASDSHLGLATVPHSMERLGVVELPPFIAALKADVKLVMTAHLGILSVDGPGAPPATLSPNIINGLLRRELGFSGVVITDALDMRAIHQGELLREDALRAAKAGADLLLVTSDPLDQTRVYESLLNAVQTGKFGMDELNASIARIAQLKKWLCGQPPAPELDVIQSAVHKKIADEIAEKSITLVRDHSRLLPIRLESDKRIAVVIPAPQDLTPADTSSYVMPKLADSIHAYHPRVDEFVISLSTNEQEQASIINQAQEYDLIVIGTINAYAEEKQAEFVRSVLQTGIPTIVVSMRLPYDLMAFPEASTFVCVYSILEPSMRAAARALFGHGEMAGHLPVSIPGLYEAGYSSQMV